MRYVLDTNVVSRVLDGDERSLSALAAVESIAEFARDFARAFAKP